MYSPHDSGAPEPLDRLLHWLRAQRLWMKWLIAVLTSVVALALIAVCVQYFIVTTFLRPHSVGPAHWVIVLLFLRL